MSPDTQQASGAAAGPTGPVSPYQVLVFVLCFLIVLIDGFDTQAVAFAAPVLRHELGGGHNALGLLFSAGLLGGLIGGLVFGPVGDRLGRRPILVAALAIVAAGTLATAAVHGAPALAALRFFTGLGLGGAIPGVIALAAEYAPPGRRKLIVSLVFSGFPLGAVVGSLVSAWVLPHLGWRAIFVIGAAAPAILLPLCFFLLPESLAHLRARRGSDQAAARIVARLGPQATRALGEDGSDHHAPRNTIVDLFSEGRAAGTALLWLICFVSLLATYCTISWLPTLVREAGLPLSTAVLAAGSINVGSVLGNIVLSRLGDRISPFRPIAASFLLGGLCVGLIGQATGSSGAMLGVCLAAGAFAVGAQLSITALIAAYYPARLRATGVGWSFGVGRLGGVVGPMIAGLLLAADIGFDRLMFVIGAIFVIAAAAVMLLARTQGAPAVRPVAEGAR
jgi:AAHS family 4-hydroxybenzoate transporter-like MFS transporter